MDKGVPPVIELHENFCKIIGIGFVGLVVGGLSPRHVVKLPRALMARLERKFIVAKSM
jgi:hypothetical protein